MKKLVPLICLCAFVAVPQTRAQDGAIITPEKTNQVPFAAIQAEVEEFFVGKKYQPITILTREDAAELFALLEKNKWPVPDGDEMLKRILPANDFMVRELRAPVAERFLSHIARDPEGFDRVDRMRKLPRGHIFLHDLILNPGGYKFIDYMTNTPGGEYLGKQVSRVPKGRNFNARTGRIYTVAQLLRELKRAYATEDAPAT